MSKLDLLLASTQYDLFSSFVANENQIESVSNTIEFWENIPKYSCTPRQVEKLRLSNGLARSYKKGYLFKDDFYTLKTQPALIEQPDKSEMAFFPGATEELIEEVLKKILTIQNHGIHDEKKSETWVGFSLSLLQRELKTRGKSRNINQIKQAIRVMSLCTLTLYKGRKKIWVGSILQDLLTIDRDDYLTDPKKQHIARLPIFITKAINRREYRQFNYGLHMALRGQLSRFIYKRLIHRYRQASISNSYHFMFSDLKNSGLLEQSSDSDNRKKVIQALDELKTRNIIIVFDVKEKRKGLKIIDAKYTVIASLRFESEQKASNKRVKDYSMLITSK